MTEIELPELARRFSALYTGLLTDVLDGLGYLEQTLPGELAPLGPGMRLAGPAYPVEGRPQSGHAYEASLRRTLEMLGAVPAGHVAVYQAHDRETAHLGELSVTSLKARGCAGAVIDGGCRDVGMILRAGFPVFARHTTPVDCTLRWQLEAHGDVEIEIGGVRIGRGDYVVGDLDGIVVVPRDLVGQVLQGAEEKAATEGLVRDAVRDGMLPLDAYERYGTF